MTTPETIAVGDARFPISHFANCEQRAQRNHSQSIRRLAARGGVCWYEARCILENRGLWESKPSSDGEDERIVRAILEKGDA